MPASQGDIREGRNEEEKQALALAQGSTRVRSGDRRGTCRVHLRSGLQDPRITPYQGGRGAPGSQVSSGLKRPGSNLD
jgi:hypothetical protein